MIKKNKRRKKIFKRELILEKLDKLGAITFEKALILAWQIYSFSIKMSLPYAQSYNALKNLKQTEKAFLEDFKTRKAFSSFVSKMEKDGLISRKGKDKLTITHRGRIFAKKKLKTPSWSKTYKIKKIDNNSLVLVVFDVPEKEKTKRDWLRFQLVGLGFYKLQQSVWWGTNLLPQDFLEDLEKYNMLSYVHILSVKRKGTISKLLN